MILRAPSCGFVLLVSLSLGTGCGARSSGIGGGQGGVAGGLGGAAGSADSGGRPEPSGGTEATSGGAGEGGAAGCSGACAAAGWPGASDVVALDTAGLILGNVSGATYVPKSDGATAVLWVVANIPGSLHRLLQSDAGFVPDVEGGWADGKLLRFADGSGAADAESVTLGPTADDGLYVASEHDNAAPAISRLSILRYDVSQAGTSLSATHEWDVTPVLPPLPANMGIEAITFVPDGYLTARGFFDESAGKTYDPGDYPDHGGGLFFVGVEASGVLYGFALNHLDGTAELVVELASPLPGVMSLEFDREVGYLWFGCDDVCGNQTGIFDVDADAASAHFGSFRVLAEHARPSGLPDSNNEGIAIGAEAECDSGLKPFFWVDDSAVDGVTLRRGSVRCGPFL